jgi:hypothetical protein
MSFLHSYFSSRPRQLCIWPLLCWVSLGHDGHSTGPDHRRAQLPARVHLFRRHMCVVRSGTHMPSRIYVQRDGLRSRRKATAPAAGAGPWVFMIRRAAWCDQGHRTRWRSDLCRDRASRQRRPWRRIFKSNGMSYEPVVSNSESEVVDGYDRNVCDVAVVADSVADTTANGLTPAGRAYDPAGEDRRGKCCDSASTTTHCGTHSTAGSPGGTRPCASPVPHPHQEGGLRRWLRRSPLP